MPAKQDSPKIKTLIFGPTVTGIYTYIGFIALTFTYLFSAEMDKTSTIIASLISIVLILSIRYVQIDYTNMRIREMLFLFVPIPDEWQNINAFDKIILSSYSQNVKMLSSVYHRQVKKRRYILLLMNRTTKKQQLIQSLRSLPNAVKKLDEFAEEFNLEKQDLIKEGYRKIRLRRPRRRR